MPYYTAVDKATAAPRKSASTRAIYLSDTAAMVLGLVWIVGRALYFAGYRNAVEKRLPGFFIQSTACLLLFIGAAAGVVMHLAGG